MCNDVRTSCALWKAVAACGCDIKIIINSAGASLLLNLIGGFGLRSPPSSQVMQQLAPAPCRRRPPPPLASLAPAAGSAGKFAGSAPTASGRLRPPTVAGPCRQAAPPSFPFAALSTKPPRPRACRSCHHAGNKTVTTCGKRVKYVTLVGSRHFRPSLRSSPPKMADPPTVDA